MVAPVTEARRPAVPVGNRFADLQESTAATNTTIDALVSRNRTALPEKRWNHECGRFELPPMPEKESGEKSLNHDVVVTSPRVKCRRLFAGGHEAARIARVRMDRLQSLRASLKH
jgi:hypothetical protein